MLSLKNKTIVLTRAKNQIADSSSLFKKLGANVIEFPAIEITEPDDWTEFDLLIKSKNFDIIVFTSSNAVNYFFNRLKTINQKFNYDETIILAVGSKTANTCKELFSKVDLIPKDHSSKGIIEILNNVDLSDKNVLLPQSKIAKKDLANELIKRKANVFPVTVYKNQLPDRNELKSSIELIESSKVDAFIFTSPSTFRNFISLINIQEPKKYFNQKLLAVIGETTKKELKNYELNNIILPEISTMENLAIKMLKHFNSIGD